MSAPPSQRPFWLTAGSFFLITAGVLHWRGLPLPLIPETSALIAFIAAGLLWRALGRPVG